MWNVALAELAPAGMTIRPLGGISSSSGLVAVPPMVNGTSIEDFAGIFDRMVNVTVPAPSLRVWTDESNPMTVSRVVSCVPVVVVVCVIEVVAFL